MREGKIEFMTPTVEWMASTYNKLNKELFDGVLGRCDFGLYSGTVGKNSALGYFSLRGENIGHFKGEKEIALFDDNGEFETYITQSNFYAFTRPVIKLNSAYSASEKSLASTLLHEMCHYYTYYVNCTFPSKAHGVEFKEIASKVSQKSNDLFPVETIASAEEMKEMTVSQEKINKSEKSGNHLIIVSYVKPPVSNGKTYNFGIAKCGTKSSIEKWKEAAKKYDYFFKSVDLYTCTNTEMWIRLNKWNLGRTLPTANIEAFKEKIGATFVRSLKERTEEDEINDKKKLERQDKINALIKSGKSLVNLLYYGNNYKEIDYGNTTTNSGSLTINNIPYNVTVEKDAYYLKLNVYFEDFNRACLTFEDYVGIDNFYDKLVGYDTSFSRGDYKYMGTKLSKFAKSIDKRKRQLPTN